MFSGVALSELLTVTIAASNGILPSTVQSVRLRQPLMVSSTCNMDTVVDPQRIYSAIDKSKESVRNTTRALCVLDSGSVAVMVMVC